jgi:hypothetical protein
MIIVRDQKPSVNDISKKRQRFVIDGAVDQYKPLASREGLIMITKINEARYKSIS